MKLTAAGKVVVGVFLIIMVGAMYMLFFRPEPDTGPDLSQPAPLPAGIKFPLRGDDLAAFSKKAAKTRRQLDFCSFYSYYADNRGVPIMFEAYISKDARDSPYYYVDPETQREYYPAWYIKPNSKGLKIAQAAAEGDIEELPPCMLAGEDQVPMPILLGFERGQKPSSDIVQVQGIIWWDSLSLNPAQQESAAGQATTGIPVVQVGHVTPKTPSSVAKPAVRQRILNLAFQRGAAILRVSRIEFAPDETRVWIQLLNKSGSPLPAWTGNSDATLREEGGPSMNPGTGQDAESAAEDEQTPDDLLPEEDIPAKGGGGLRGYLVFPAVQDSNTLFLNLPEPNTRVDEGGLPISIKLRPEFNEPAG